MPTKRTGDRVSEVTKRGLLASAGAGAAGLIAGCSGLSGGGPGGSGGEDIPDMVEGRTLKWFMNMDPQNITWFNTGVFPGEKGRFYPSFASIPVDFTMEDGIYGPWMNTAVRDGDINYATYENVDITEKEVTIKLRDDATWSNGDDVTAPDALADIVAYRLWQTKDSFTKVHEEGSDRFINAVTDYEVVDDKTAKLKTSDSFNMIEQDIWIALVRDGRGWGGIWNNTSLEPFDKWWSSIQDYFEMAQNGEIDPFGADADFNIATALGEDILPGWSANPDENTYDLKWEKHYAKPENVATVGAWTPKSINGSQSITLEPNEHHYAADQVNFEEVELIRRQSNRANRAAIRSNSQDYYRGDVPVHITESFPDGIEERQIPAQDGLCFAVNHRHKLFSERKARQAIMHAIDRERLAKSVHDSKFDVVSKPGGDVYKMADVAGEDWISENLQAYETDLERADELMREAGFSKENGQWLTGDGEPITLTIPSSKATPQLEPTLAGQLSEFGIDTSMQSHSSSVYQEKLNAGEFDIWRTGEGVGYASIAVGRMWLYFVIVKTWAQNWYRVFPAEQVEEAKYVGGGGIDETEENRKTFKLQAPPVGEPDGDLQTWHPVNMSFNSLFPGGRDRYERLIRELGWLYNWYVPVIPIANGRTQHFLDVEAWSWPETDSAAWDGVGVAQFQPEDLAALGEHVFALKD